MFFGFMSDTNNNPGKIRNFSRSILRKGGIRLKIIGFIILIILITVGVLNYFIINLMEKTLSAKAFEVVEMSLDHIGDSTHIALLERTLENKVNLEDILKQTKESNQNGLLDITTYSTVKTNDQLELNYFSGFTERTDNNKFLDTQLAGQLVKAEKEKIIQEPYLFYKDGKSIPSFRFTKPIHYEYEGESHLLGAVVIVYSRAAISATTRKVIVVSTFLTVAMILLSSAVVFELGSHLSSPIIRAANAASKVTRGNLDVDLKINTNDELETLGNEFNNMVKRLREKRMMKKFVSSSTINMIKQGQDNSSNVQLGGEHKNLTIFFSDVRDFTALSEKISPKEVIKIVNFYLNLQADIIQKWGGDIDKYIGDAVMAAFGGKGSIERALQAALEIQRTIAEKNSEREKDNLTIMQIGIGINNGEVVAGNIGSSDRMNFTSIGSPVNLAFRLCMKARPNEILISKASFDQAKPGHEAELIGPIVQKGFSSPVDIMIVNS